MKYYLLHKPRGCITSTVDDTGRGRPTVYDVAKAAGIPSFGPVGRLDFETSGVLLFTDDYKLKKAISSPSYKGKAEVGTVPSMEKVYHALVAGTVTPDEAGVHTLRQPLHFSRKLDGPGGSWTKPAEARVLLTKTFMPGQPVPWRFKPGSTATITWIEVVLREGKNRQIRRLCRRSEFELTRLHRVSVGPIVLGDLKEACCRELSRGEVKALYKRCLPEDPLCPTVSQVQHILTCRVKLATRRARAARHCRVCKIDMCSHENCSGVGTESAIVPDSGERSGLGELAADRGARGAVTEDLAFIVRHIIDFSRRDLHETPEGSQDDADETEICPGEGESLAQARAIPPNVAHMTCGYRSSQIERLGLTYGSM